MTTIPRTLSPATAKRLRDAERLAFMESEHYVFVLLPAGPGTRRRTWRYVPISALRHFGEADKRRGGPHPKLSTNDHGRALVLYFAALHAIDHPKDGEAIAATMIRFMRAPTAMLETLSAAVERASAARHRLTETRARAIVNEVLTATGLTLHDRTLRRLLERKTPLGQDTRRKA